MVNLTRHEDARRWDFWRGGDVRHEAIESHGIRIMSVGFLLGERQALTMGAPLLTAALRQLVHQVEWGELDILLIDLPPGTADLQQQLIGVVSLDGAVVVVGPQDVAHLDARKFLDFPSRGGRARARRSGEHERSRVPALRRAHRGLHARYGGAIGVGGRRALTRAHSARSCARSPRRVQRCAERGIRRGRRAGVRRASSGARLREEAARRPARRARTGGDTHAGAGARACGARAGT